MHSGNKFSAHSRDHRYGKVYNRNLPKWYKRQPDSWIPIIEVRPNSPFCDRRRLVASAFIPGWGHMNSPVLRPVNDDDLKEVIDCPDDVCSV